MPNETANAKQSKDFRVIAAIAGLAILIIAFVTIQRVRDRGQKKSKVQELINAFPNSSFSFRTGSVNVETDVSTAPVGQLYCVIADNPDSEALIGRLVSLPESQTLEALVIHSVEPNDTVPLALTATTMNKLRSRSNLRSLSILELEMDAKQLDAMFSLKLRRITISGAWFDDAALKRLLGADSLSELDISLTNVTDESFTTLLQMPNLKYLKCNDTHITPPKLGGFRAARPHIFIDAPDLKNE